MSNYFNNFPKVDYRFGNQSTTNVFQHLGTYVDVIDQVKDYSVYYQTFNIRNGERPEQLSYSLYRDTNYYWTFYLLNDHIRESGWPIRDADVYAKAQKYYPNKVSHVTGVVQKQGIKAFADGNDVNVVWVPTDELLPLCKSETFKVGNYVYFSSSKVAGQILAIDQKMGDISHDAMGIRSESVDRTMETISEEDAINVKADPDYEPLARYERMEVVKNYDEFDAPHHYEDASANWIWPEWAEKYPNGLDRNNVNTVNSISNYQRLSELNVEQQVISVIKQDSINQIIAEFNRLLVNK